MTTTLPIEELEQSGESELGTSDWHEITQEQINLFAEATGDHQWIHVDPEAAANGPFGTTVAHGYLTLSMLPMMLSEIVSVSDAVMGVNYGTEKIRFTSPVPSGSRVRLHAKLARAERRGPSVVWTVGVQIEIEGKEKAALVGAGMNLARRAALLAGLPETVPGTTVNRFCASSLQTIRMAFHAIRAGEGDVYVAAGVESISQVDGYPKDVEELHPKLFGDDAPIANVYITMGMTAENVAERWDVSREEMDRYAQRSQERAVGAQDSGFFAREITPWDGVAADDGPRRESSLEKLAELEPAFKPDGKVTA